MRTVLWCKLRLCCIISENSGIFLHTGILYFFTLFVNYMILHYEYILKLTPHFKMKIELRTYNDWTFKYDYVN